MKSLGTDIKIEYTPTPVAFKSRRDELVSRITEGINNRRIGTKYKPLTTRTVAIRINLNPAISKDDGELELLIKDCERVGNYKKFFWVTNGKLDKKK